MIKEVITHIDPKSPISEVFRSLRTNIQFMNSKLDTLLVTSTMQAEGKSWTTSNLAATFAQAGKKVIIVDSDMRKGRQSGIFGVSPRPGLSNFLSGIDENGKETQEGIVHYIQETQVDNLFIIPAGNVPPNPSELLVSDKMKELITSLKEICDLIIFDGTPSLLVTDSVILSRLVDSTIIVTSYKETKMDNLQKIKKDIENVGGKVSGVIINKIPISQKKYASAYYYGSKGSKSSGRHKPLKTLDSANTNTHKTTVSDLQKSLDTAQSNSTSAEEVILAERAKNIQQIDKNAYTAQRTESVQQNINTQPSFSATQTTDTTVQPNTTDQQAVLVHMNPTQQSATTETQSNNNIQPSYSSYQSTTNNNTDKSVTNNQFNNEQQNNGSYQAYNTVAKPVYSDNVAQETNTANEISLDRPNGTVEKTEELLRKINNYLEAEKGKLNN